MGTVVGDGSAVGVEVIVGSGEGRGVDVGGSAVAVTLRTIWSFSNLIWLSWVGVNA